jgi:hypothetical protein
MLARNHWSESRLLLRARLGRVAIDALQDPAVPVKIDAVKSISQYGSPTAKPAIFDAFR